MENYRSALEFVERAQLSSASEFLESELEVLQTPQAALDQLNLDHLPKSLVAGNTLLDLSATPETIRGPLSLALAFAGRAASAATIGKPEMDEDDWFAEYKSNLMRLGFGVSPSAFVTSRFKKKNVAVHKAIIPFLTIALGGAGVGPVILELLKSLNSMDENQPWITLFNKESRKFDIREMSFGAVASDIVETRIRHVTARLQVSDKALNILFFKITSASAEFESATTLFSINNNLLAVLEKPLRDRLEQSALDFIRIAPLTNG
ncbi:hypothetical protein [Asticcacaulis sp.]|uniref:hypothetical protein n=1 Tax=Asticcacaulis sp. TaxID=1872648 RepID=UPI0026274940|nr:hypothetical protein [Asticcacaulis sp.]